MSLTNRNERIEQMLYALSRVPGLGFLRQYAEQMGTLNNKVSRARADIEGHKGSVSDAKNALRDARKR